MPKEQQTAMSQQDQTTATPPKYDIRINSIMPEGAIRATASVTLYGEFAIHDITIRAASKGLFVSMPSRKSANGEYRDICFPCTREARLEFDAAILDGYRQTIAQWQASAQEAQEEVFPGQTMG